MKTKFFVILILLGFAGQVGAAMFPMARMAIKDGAEFAEELKKPLGKLIATPQEFQVAFSEAHPELGIKTEEELFSYVETLRVVDCPQGVPYRLSSIVVTEGIRKVGWIVRPFNKGERCWQDANFAKVVGSPDCGNIGAPVPVKEKPVLVAPPKLVVEKAEGWSPNLNLVGYVAGLDVDDIQSVDGSNAMSRHTAEQLHFNANLGVGLVKHVGLKGTKIFQNQSQTQGQTAEATAGAESDSTVVVLPPSTPAVPGGDPDPHIPPQGGGPGGHNPNQ